MSLKRLGLVVLLLLGATPAHAQQEHPDYREGGSSGPGLYGATRRVRSLSVLKPRDPQYVEPHSYYAHRSLGNLILQNPDSRFAAILWREDALGDQLGILDSGGAELPGPWRKEMKDRFWAGEWSGNVTLFSWSPDGEEMVVQTSDIYNEGGIYWLDLYNRTARQVGSIRNGGEVVRVDWGHRQLLRKESANTIALPSQGPRGNLRGTDEAKH